MIYDAKRETWANAYRKECPRAIGVAPIARRWSAAVLFLAPFLCAAQDRASNPATNAAINVFQIPKLVMEQQAAQLQLAQFFQQKQYAEAEQLLLAAIRRNPSLALNYYNLACVKARQDRIDQALDYLERAVTNGFTDVRALRADADIDNLRRSDRYAAVLAAAEAYATGAPDGLVSHFEPAPVVDGVAIVSESNTLWDAQLNLFRAMFALSPTNRVTEPIVLGQGRAGELLRAWRKEQTAAGLDGVLYDNRDERHSALDLRNFPGMAAIKYRTASAEANLRHGLQADFIFNLPTLGNSSTALLGAFWRSNPRIAMLSPQAMNALYFQYVNNHIYFYPEHNDYDPGHNGKEGGYGDVFPANIPYVIISQGSSWSDQPFMQAVACTLAAFRKETRQALVLSGTLAPTVQMIFRMSNKTVASPDSYLSGIAHPPVFSATNLDVEKMVNMAHALKPDEIPPLIQLRVVQEDIPAHDIDYFDVGNREKLFDTPAAIARVVRATGYYRRIVVSAENSRDVNGRALTYRWVVLRGDKEAIRIRPLNAAASVVELMVPYHERRPIAPDSRMESNRVDIGAFAHNGVNYSAPGFVTFYYLDNEKRVYNERKQIQSVTYSSPRKGGNYVDPWIDLPKDWRDEYHYDAQAHLTGWTRQRGDVVEGFTADGALATERDAVGRATTARTVQYVTDKPSAKTAGVLRQVDGPVIVHYGYRSPQDRVGYIVSRSNVEKLPPGGQ